MTHGVSRWMTATAGALVAIALAAGTLAAAPAKEKKSGGEPLKWGPHFVDHDQIAETLPLLRWDLLAKTVYDPRKEAEWPAEIAAMNGKRVRMEGYLMPRYESQDPEDLLLTGVNPVNLFCGPSDITMIVDLYMPGFEYDLWPYLPVQVIGTFHLSPNWGDYRPIYLFRGESWKPLKVFEQSFPGVVLPRGQEPDDTDDP